MTSPLKRHLQERSNVTLSHTNKHLLARLAYGGSCFLLLPPQSREPPKFILFTLGNPYAVPRLASARSRSGSDNRTGLSFTPLAPFRYLPEEGFLLIPLYHKSAEKVRVIFRLRRSDMIACAIVILKPYGFSDILFASKLA